MKPKPNYNSVDLTEAEWEDSDDTVSFALVNAHISIHLLDPHRNQISKNQMIIKIKFYQSAEPVSGTLNVTCGHEY